MPLSNSTNQTHRKEFRTQYQHRRIKKIFFFRTEFLIGRRRFDRVVNVTEGQLFNLFERNLNTSEIISQQENEVTEDSQIPPKQSDTCQNESENDSTKDEDEISMKHRLPRLFVEVSVNSPRLNHSGNSPPLLPQSCFDNSLRLYFKQGPGYRYRGPISHRGAGLWIGCKVRQ